MDAGKRELLFSVTKEDCDWEAMTSGGPGGQHANKVCSAIRCTHKLSGAVGEARDTKSQLQNRKLAFGRMARSLAFTRWLRIETARRLGKEVEKERTRGRSSDHEDRIRTYHFAKQRVTDHRTGITLNDVYKVMGGAIDPFIEAMVLKQLEG